MKGPVQSAPSLRQVARERRPLSAGWCYCGNRGRHVVILLAVVPLVLIVAWLQVGAPITYPPYINDETTSHPAHQDQSRLLLPSVGDKWTPQEWEAWSLLHLPPIVKESSSTNESTQHGQRIFFPTPFHNINTTTSITTKSFSIVTLTGIDDFGTGSNARINQDRAAVIHWNQHDCSQKQHTDARWWMGLFDGHGDHGHVVAHFVLLSFCNRLRQLPPSSSSSSSMKEEAATIRWLSHTYSEINMALPRLQGGCTGVSILRLGERMYISNAGDSIAFIMSWDPLLQEARIVYRNKLHKPDDDSERERVTKAGGVVIVDDNGTFRLANPDTVNDKTAPALAMSRGFGDFDILGFIPDPTIDVLDISQWKKSTLEYFAVVSSDGLVDEIPLEDVATVLGVYGSQNFVQSTKQLFVDATRLWKTGFAQEEFDYRDDMTLVIHRIEK